MGCLAQLYVGYTHPGSGAKSFINACCCAAEAVFYRRVDPVGVAEQSGQAQAVGMRVRHAAFLRVLGSD